MPDSQFSSKGKTFLPKVEISSEKLLMMIEDILNYSNINASENLVESLDLTDILNDIESDLEVLIQQNHAAIYFVPLPKIEGAPVLIHQLFYNLIHNSLKFSKPDVKQEITIQSKTDPETLHVKIIPIKNVPGAKPFNPCQVAHIEPATGIIFLLRACVHEAGNGSLGTIIPTCARC